MKDKNGEKKQQKRPEEEEREEGEDIEVRAVMKNIRQC